MPCSSSVLVAVPYSPLAWVLYQKDAPRAARAQDGRGADGSTSPGSTPPTPAQRQRIVGDALATDQQDAEDLLRRQRARLDACASPVSPPPAVSHRPTAQCAIAAHVFVIMNLGRTVTGLVQ